MLLGFVGICIASFFNRNLKPVSCLYVVRGKVRISKTTLIELCPENVFDSTIYLSVIWGIFLLLFSIAGLASMAQSTFLSAGRTVTDEKDEPK